MGIENKKTQVNVDDTQPRKPDLQDILKKQKEVVEGLVKKGTGPLPPQPKRESKNS